MDEIISIALEDGPDDGVGWHRQAMEKRKKICYR